MLVRRNVSRIQLAMILLGFPDGSHFTMKGVEWIRCTAYRVEPVIGTNIRSTYNNIDGEKVEFGPIQGVVHPKAIKYFIAPPDNKLS
jgi:diacylglycerol kinase family enzyme